MKVFSYLALMILGFIPLHAGVEEYEKVEELVFKHNEPEYIRSLMVNIDGDPAVFQRALIEYRLGNIETNVQRLENATKQLKELTARVSNVFTFSYLGVCHALLAQVGRGRLGHTRQSLDALNTAVNLDPSHYLPRFFRGMTLLFLPGFMGGNEKQGLKDMAVVLPQVPSIKKDNDYKAFIYFINGIYYGERKKDFDRALQMMELADNLVVKPDFRDSIKKLLEKYRQMMPVKETNR